MKKLLSILLSAALVLSLAPGAMARGWRHQAVANRISQGFSACRFRVPCSQCGTGHCGQGRFVDADGDGICDNCHLAHCQSDLATYVEAYVPAETAAVCGVCGTGHCGQGNYADADNDGICDNCGLAHCGNFVDADGDGVCDNQGSGQHHGWANCGTCGAGHCGQGNYVDADNDGVCDNCGLAHCGNYVDADGDGVCDNLGSGNCGNGSGSWAGSGRHGGGHHGGRGCW